jgi:hypothetical protein
MIPFDLGPIAYLHHRQTRRYLQHLSQRTFVFRRQMQDDDVRGTAVGSNVLEEGLAGFYRLLGYRRVSSYPRRS